MLKASKSFISVNKITIIIELKKRLKKNIHQHKKGACLFNFFCLFFLASNASKRKMYLSVFFSVVGLLLLMPLLNEKKKEVTFRVTCLLVYNAIRKDPQNEYRKTNSFVLLFFSLSNLN